MYTWCSNNNSSNINVETDENGGAWRWQQFLNVIRLYLWMSIAHVWWIGTYFSLIVLKKVVIYN